MKRMMIGILPLAACLLLSAAAWAGSYEPYDDGAKAPWVYFSDWESEAVSETMYAYSRDITVSDGGNYLMTYLNISGSGRYYYSYEAIWQGRGTQKVFSYDWGSEEIRIGKLFRFESMDECGMEIDQIISDHITLQASDSSGFILVFRPNGGKYDGTVQTVTVMNGVRELTSDSYAETTSIELLGVFRFPEEERGALHFGQNVIQPDSTGYQIQMAVQADVEDGIALMVYTNSSGNEVSVVQPVMDGYGVLTAYDGADTVEEIRVGQFGIAGFSYGYTDALFEGIDFDDTAGGNPNQPETEPAPTGLETFLTGGAAGAVPGGQDENNPSQTAGDGVHRITLTDQEEVVTECPETAKAGDIVIVRTMDMADAEPVIEVNGANPGKWVDFTTYTFIMPDEDVEVHAFISTFGYPGA